MKKKIIFLISNEPVPVITQKINELHRTGKYDIYLIYWHRLHSTNDFPFSVCISKDHILTINLPEPRGNIVRRIFLTIIFFTLSFNLIQKINPHSIHCVNMDIWLPLIVMNTFNKKFKVILDLLDSRDSFLKWNLNHAISKFIEKTALFFITSPGYATDYLNRFRLDPKDPRIVFIPNAPSRTLFDHFKNRKGDGLVIGYIGTFRGKKTIEDFVETVKLLNVNKKSVNIIFAGVGPRLDLVKHYASKFDFIKYLGPYNYQKDIKKIYEQVDIIFSMYYPSHDKMIHMSCRYHDAVVCRIPIIVQKGSLLAKLVEHHQTGYVLELGQRKEMEDLLNRLVDNPDDLKTKAKNCHSLLKENLFETYIPRLVNAYHRILDDDET